MSPTFHNHDRLRILGETRAADQVIRLPAPDGKVESMAISSTFHHEWAHYVQFSCTAIGVMLSMYRRTCLDALIRAVCLNVSEARRPNTKFVFSVPIDDYWKRLERLAANWRKWPDDWHVVGERRARSISRVMHQRDGLVIELAGLDGVFRLPIGPSQIFESWAWIIEYLHDPSAEVPEDVSSLIYTWPLWIEASALRRRPRDLSTAQIAALQPLLFTSMFYDFTIMDFSGPAEIPQDWTSCVADLKDRAVTCGRMYWQLATDRRRGKFAEPAGLHQIDAYLSDRGLITLSDMVTRTGQLVHFLSELKDHETAQARVSAEQRGGEAQLMHVYAERDLLTVSSQNINVLRQFLDVALLSPSRLLPQIIPAVCAFQTPAHYVWASLIFDQSDDETSKAMMSTRVRLRQQLAIYEHVIQRYATGNHLGCYDSPEWPVPINACPHALSCMSLPTKIGIQFCRDPDWRVKIGSILLPLALWSSTELNDDNVPGISAVGAEFAALLGAPTTKTLDISALNFDSR